MAETSGQGKKRKKSSYYKYSGNKWAKLEHTLQPGLKGFLVSCNHEEEEATREAYFLLNEHADELFGPESLKKETESPVEDDIDYDIADAVKKEVSDLKSRGKMARRFHKLDCGANNLIFIRTTLDDPTPITDSIFDDLYRTGKSKSRRILRLLPVVATCKASVDNLTKALPDILQPYFSEGAPTYFLNFKVRNNNSVSRTILLPVFLEVIQELNSESKGVFNDAELVINIDVIKTVCCVSILKEFYKYKKYNVQEVGIAARARLQEEAGDHHTECQDDLASAADSWNQALEAEAEVKCTVSQDNTEPDAEDTLIKDTEQQDQGSQEETDKSTN